MIKVNKKFEMVGLLENIKEKNQNLILRQSDVSPYLYTPLSRS